MSTEVYAIPMPTYLKKFCLAEFKLQEPVKLKENNLVGREVLKVLTDHRKSKGHERFDTELKVELNWHMANRSVTIGKLTMVNESLIKIFKHCMFSYMSGQLDAGIPASQSVKNFLDKYRITESQYSADTAYREWQRYKNDEYGRAKRAKNNHAPLSQCA